MMVEFKFQGLRTNTGDEYVAPGGETTEWTQSSSNQLSSLALELAFASHLGANFKIPELVNLFDKTDTVTEEDLETVLETSVLSDNFGALVPQLLNRVTTIRSCMYNEGIHVSDKDAFLESLRNAVDYAKNLDREE